MSLIAIEAEWEYQSAANTIPADLESVVVPSAGWLGPSEAPFGTLGELITDNAINTTWDFNSGLWIRRNVTTDGLRDILLQGRIFYTAYVYWDGEYVGSVNPENTVLADARDWYMTIPKALATSGSHSIALLCLSTTQNASLVSETESAFALSHDGDSDLLSIETDTALALTIPKAGYVYASADYLPAMISLQPEAPAKEILEWMTDLFPAKDGNEERIKVRVSPRQFFQYTYPASAVEQPRAKTLMLGARAEPWVVPVWSQAQRIGAVVADQFTISSIETSNREFRASSLALLWQDSDTWQVVGIDTVDVSSLVLTTPTQAFTNAWLMPLRFGHVEVSPTRKFTGYNSRLTFTFEIDDNAEITITVPTQYNGDDIYFDEILQADNVDTVISPLDIFDSELGSKVYYQAWTRAKTARQFRWVSEGHDEAWTVRDFFHRRAGRYRQYWQPSFEYDLRFTNTGTIINSLTVRKDEHQKYGTDRTHIAVEAAGVWYARSITSVIEIDANTIQLNLNSNLNVAANTVSNVCWLGLKRLDTDRVEIDWIGNEVSQTQIRTLEIDF